MKKLRYFLIKNKVILIITLIVFICAIAIAIGVYAQVTNKKVISSTKNNKNNDYEDLENNFDYIFTNSINKEVTAKQDINYDEIIYLAYNIPPEEDKNYTIDAKMPLFKIENEVTKQINQEIYNTFGNTIRDIVYNTTSNTIFNLDYVVYVNNNILSLVIRCKYKDGINPQRNIIQTYNYDLDNNKLVNINDLIEYKNLNRDDIQERISNKIKEKNIQMQTIINQGYNVYIRNEQDDIYKVDNTPNYFLGKNNYLYLVYAYGNNNYTSEIDLVIF